MRGGIKFIVVLCFFISIGAGVWGITILEEGLDLKDIIPKSSPVFDFLDAQQKYFNFFHMYAITQGNFEYPMKQQLLHDYHESFNRIPSIIKNDDGGLPDSWLVLFRDWLVGLQRAFDNDWDRGLVMEEGWNTNASDKSVLAYKLLVQTGHVDHPIDKSLVSQVRLVDSNGIINPRAFYNYLTAWYSNDVLAYTASQADLRPTPRIWYHERSDNDLKIPKSSRLVYTQFPFLLSQLPDAAAIIEMVQSIRDVCKNFEEKGLPNFPSGVPFTYWEQYIHLRLFLIMTLGVVIATLFAIMTVICMSVWASSLAIFMMSALVLQVTGLLGLFGLKLSAIPALFIVASIGIGAEFMIHIIVAFQTFIGDRSHRSQSAILSVTAVAISAVFCFMVAISPLILSDLYFVRRYFFVSISIILGLSTFDCLIVLPVLLSVVGPPAFLTPCGSSKLPPPSPPQIYNSHPKIEEVTEENHKKPSGLKPCYQSRLPTTYDGTSHVLSSPRRQYQSSAHRSSNLSLTTITEEEASNSSGSPKALHEILVEPKVVVETTTFGPSSDKDSRGSPEASNHITTTVTATAKVKVEVHNKGNSAYVKRIPTTVKGSQSDLNVEAKTNESEHSDREGTDSSISSGFNSS